MFLLNFCLRMLVRHSLYVSIELIVHIVPRQILFVEIKYVTSKEGRKTSRRLLVFTVPKEEYK